MSPTSHTSVRLRTDVVERLRSLTRQTAAAADRDITQSDLLAFVLDYFGENLNAETIAELIGGTQDRNRQRAHDPAEIQRRAAQLGPITGEPGSGMAPSETGTRPAGAESETRTDDS